jgi:hypothetical protein
MTASLVKTSPDKQVDDAGVAQVRGTLVLPPSMRVADLPCPIKADWLKRRPLERRV